MSVRDCWGSGRTGGLKAALRSHVYLDHFYSLDFMKEAMLHGSGF